LRYVHQQGLYELTPDTKTGVRSEEQGLSVIVAARRVDSIRMLYGIVPASHATMYLAAMPEFFRPTNFSLSNKTRSDK